MTTTNTEAAAKTRAAKPPVQWCRPTSDPKDMRGEFQYVSKCGRFRIEKRLMSSSGGCWNDAQYTLFVDGAIKNRCDTFTEAKEFANWQIDPSWEPKV